MYLLVMTALPESSLPLSVTSASVVLHVPPRSLSFWVNVHSKSFSYPAMLEWSFHWPAAHGLKRSLPFWTPALLEQPSREGAGGKRFSSP